LVVQLGERKHRTAQFEVPRVPNALKAKYLKHKATESGKILIPTLKKLETFEENYELQNTFKHQV